MPHRRTRSRRLRRPPDRMRGEALPAPGAVRPSPEAGLATAREEAVVELGTERFRRRDHVAINALWVGVHFQDAALMAIIVPALLLQLTPANHTYVLAVISTAVAIGAAIVPPFAGALSDRLRRRGGDRRVQTAVVLAIDALALVAMAYVQSAFDLGRNRGRRDDRADQRIRRLSSARAGDRSAAVLGDGRRVSRRDDAARNDRRPAARRAPARRASRSWRRRAA